MNVKSTLAYIALASVVPGVYAAQTVGEIKVNLGQTLFFDQNLSLNRNQSCASCHNPALAFTDSEPNQVESAASLGSDETSIGDRNTPSINYAASSPELHFDESLGRFRGGQFWDGGAGTLENQARQPLFNPKEMALTDKAMLSKRIRQTGYYIENFPKAFGLPVFSDDESLLAAVARSLAAFQKADFFRPFDSKYDRYLHGDYQLSAMEETGRALFFSKTRSNCTNCHRYGRGGDLMEPFSNFSYYNIGVPVNRALRSKNGMDQGFRDAGFTLATDRENFPGRGRFKVPVLRNVVVTSPYMHNGIFRELKTVLEFHDRHNNRARSLNPETRSLWAEPETGEWIDSTILEGRILSDQDIDALIAFLKLLTDRRYEKLIDG
jgi:cytochrome c peroxidase